MGWYIYENRQYNELRVCQRCQFASFVQLLANHLNQVLYSTCSLVGGVIHIKGTEEDSHFFN